MPVEIDAVLHGTVGRMFAALAFNHQLDPSSAAPLRQGVRHQGSDRPPPPVTGRRYVRRLVRCLSLQPGTACQVRSAAGIPKASA